MPVTHGTTAGGRKERLSLERREDLRIIYKVGREDLRSFRETFYQFIGILSAVPLALVAAGLRYHVLLLIVPPVLAVLLISSVSYLAWRGQLIESVAAIERVLDVPHECAYETLVREEGGLAPPFLSNRVVQVALIACAAALLVAEYLIVTLVPP